MALPLKLATACLLRQEGKTLFIDYTSGHHLIHASKFAFPGGKMRMNESPEACVRREVKEETNITTRTLLYRGKVYFSNENRTINDIPMEHNWQVYFYDCLDFDDSRAKASEGKLSWVEDNKVLELSLHEGDCFIWKEWLTKYRLFDGIITYEGERLKEGKLNSCTAS